jgi:hypothetical protein
MHSRNVVLSAFLSSLITSLLIVVILFGVGTTLANNPLQADNSPDNPEEPDETLAIDYMHATGYAFKSIIEGTTYTNSAGGCLYTTAGAPYLFSGIIIPDGSVIEYVRMYYKDTSEANDASLVLYQYGEGSSTNLLTISTVGTYPGVRTHSESVDIVINNAVYGYGFEWAAPGNSDTTQICGYRITYTPPSIFGVALPIIMK